MNGEDRKPSEKHTISFKSIAFVAFLILIILVALAYTSYTNLSVLEREHAQQQRVLKEMEWKQIESILKENQQKASIQAGFIKDNIQKDLLAAYAGKLTNLKYDMDNIKIKGDTPILHKVSDNITNKYLNIKSDANDLFVIAKWVKPTDPEKLSYKGLSIPNGAIIGDKSLDCSKNGEMRTFDIEVSMHSNKELAINALSLIIEQRVNETIFWEFLPTKNKDHYKITQSTISELKKVFDAEGLDGLKTYEMLTPVYLNPDSDIFGIDDVDNTGNRNDNYKIIVVQGFSLYETIKTTHATTIQEYEHQLRSLEERYSGNKQLVEIETILLSFLIFAIFISIIKIQNMVAESENNS